MADSATPSPDATPSPAGRVFVAVVRPDGRAMFHDPGCQYAKRAMSARYSYAEDALTDDVACSQCLPAGITSEVGQ